MVTSPFFTTIVFSNHRTSKCKVTNRSPTVVVKIRSSFVQIAPLNSSIQPTYLPTWRIINHLVVNNHGDRKSPKDRVVGPLPNGLSMAYKWGLLYNHLLTVMILQVPTYHITTLPNAPYVLNRCQLRHNAGFE